MLTADHGVDPTTSHPDHTREYAPLLAQFPDVVTRHLAGGFGLFGGMSAFSAVGMIVRSRGAGRKMSWGELTSRRRLSSGDASRFCYPNRLTSGR